MIYLNADDVKSLIRGEEVRVPDTNIVLKMPDRNELADLRLSSYLIDCEMSERRDFIKGYVIADYRAKMIERVRALKSRRKLRSDYVQVEEVVKVLGGR